MELLRLLPDRDNQPRLHEGELHPQDRDHVRAGRQGRQGQRARAQRGAIEGAMMTDIIEQSNPDIIWPYVNVAFLNLQTPT